MRKLLSIKYSANAFNTAMLLLRVGLGVLMLMHGYDKLVHFKSYEKDFMNFLGLGNTISLALVVFAEFFCSVFLILGLLTRLATIPLLIATLLMVFIAHKGEVFGDGGHAALYFIGYIVLFLVGPGKFSIDKMISK